MKLQHTQERKKERKKERTKQKKRQQQYRPQQTKKLMMEGMKEFELNDLYI